MKNLFPVLALLLLVGCTSEPIELEFSYSEFLVQVESDQVVCVDHQSDNYTLKGKTFNKESFVTVRPPFMQDDLSEALLNHRVSIGCEPETSGLQIFGLSIAALMGLFLLWIIPLILTVAVVFFVWRFLKKKVKD